MQSGVRQHSIPSPTVLWGEEKRVVGHMYVCFVSSHIAIRVAVNVNVVVGGMFVSLGKNRMTCM